MCGVRLSLVDRHQSAARRPAIKGCLKHLRRLADLRQRGVADDKPWLEQYVDAVTAAVIQSFDDGPDGTFGLLARLLADGGQIDVGKLGQHDVVVTRHRDTARDIDA